MLRGDKIHGGDICGIYKITNTVNGMVYIGGSKNLRDRKQQHTRALSGGYHHVLEMQKDYNNYPESFRFDVIEHCDEKDLVELERKYIAEYDAMNPVRGYNRESGGNKDKTISDETKKIWSDQRSNGGAGMFGKHHTDEAKRRISEKQKGKTLSEETRMKISQAKTGKHHTEETRKKWSEMRKGRKLSPEHRAAIGRARKGIVVGEEWRRHISEGHRGKNMGEENKYHKDVICIETGELFHGVKEAGRQKSVSATHISAACKGKRNVAGGFHWKYADE